MARTAARIAPCSSSSIVDANEPLCEFGAAFGTFRVPTDSSTDHLGNHGASASRSSDAPPRPCGANACVDPNRTPGGNEDLGEGSIAPVWNPPLEVMDDEGPASGWSLSRSSMLAMKVRSSGPSDGSGPAMSAPMSGKEKAKSSPVSSSSVRGDIGVRR